MDDRAGYDGMDTLTLGSHKNPTPTQPNNLLRQTGKGEMRPPVLVLGLALAVLAACCTRSALAFGFGEYRIDFDFLGGEGDLRPEQ